ncbi:MAG: ATP-binding protein [Pseudomonadota bacterium]
MRTSLSIRIFLGFLAMLAVFGGSSVYGILRMDAIRQDLQLTSQGYLQLTRSLTQVKTIAESRDAYVERALAETDPRVRQYLVRYARDFYPRVLRERLAELAQSARRLAGQSLPASDATFASEVAARLDRAVELNRAADSAAAEFFELVAEAPTAIPTEVLARQKDSATALGRELKLVSLNLDNKIAQGVLRAEEQERNAVWALIALALAGVVVGLTITVVLTRALRPLTDLTEAARAISRGAFDVRIEATRRHDEIGTLALSFADMARALRDREVVLARRRVEFESLNAFLENVLHSVSTGVVVCNRERGITVANRAARRLMGLTLVDPVGRSIDEIPLGGLLEEHWTEIQRVLDDATPLKREAQALRPADGPSVLVDLRVLPFTQPGAPSNVGGWVFLLDDVSERERTRERLLQSERLAAMGRLAAQVAHEIRNPLSSIGLNCELLADDLQRVAADDGDVQRLLGAIAAEIDRLTEITDGYLRYARLPEASLRPADVGDVVRDVADFVRADLERRGLSLELQVARDLPSLSVDPSRVRLALLNLLRNAADATLDGGSIQLSVDRVDDAVQISVDDHGAGVPEELVPKLFEAFFSTKPDGTGLGLSVTRDVALEHGGVAGYEPRSEGGSRFFLRLAALPPQDG